jgi:diacylglycerol diphosphate phosphatase/phosphatidate phosphatase
VDLLGNLPAADLHSTLHRSFWDAHNGILGLVLSLGLCVTFTDIVKVG